MFLGINWRNLRAKIIASSFVPTAIILFAVALVTFVAYQQGTEELVIERDQQLVRLSASQLAADFTEYADLLDSLARTADIYRGNIAVQRTSLQQARNRLVVFDAGVVVLNNFGVVAATQPERTEILGRDWSSRPYFRQMLHAPEPTFSNIIADGPGGSEVISLAVPVTGEQGEFVLPCKMPVQRRIGVSTLLGNRANARRSKPPLTELTEGSAQDGALGRCVRLRDIKWLSVGHD